MDTSHGIIEDLLARPFSTRTAEEQKRILHQGRPMPQFDHLTRADQLRVWAKLVQCGKFDHFTGSPARELLFCWPCLLLAPVFQKGLLSKRNVKQLGISIDDPRWCSKMVEHGASKQHQDAMVKWKALKWEIKCAELYCSEEMDGEDREKMAAVLQLLPKNGQDGGMIKNLLRPGADGDVDDGDDDDQSNEEDCERLKVHLQILTVWSEVTSSEPFQQSLGGFPDETVKNFQSTLYTYLAKLLEPVMNKPELLEQTYSLTSCPKFTLRVQFHDALMEAIKAELLDYVREELARQDFVTVCIVAVEHVKDEGHLCHRAPEPINTIFLRYTSPKDGLVVERFVGYLEVNKPITSDLLMERIRNISQEFRLEDKIISVSLDSYLITNETYFEFASKLRMGEEPEVRFNLTDCSPSLVDFVIERLRADSPEVDDFWTVFQRIQSWLHFRKPALWWKYCSEKKHNYRRWPSLAMVARFLVSNRFDMIRMLQAESVEFPVRGDMESYALKMHTLVAFCHFLTHFHHSILLRFFEFVLPQIRSLERKISKGSVRLDRVRTLVDRFRISLVKFIEENFGKLWTESLAEYQVALEIEPTDYDENILNYDDDIYVFRLPVPRDSEYHPWNLMENEPALKARCLKMIQHVIDLMHRMIVLRCCDTAIAFVDLLNSGRSEQFRRVFPDALLVKLNEFCPGKFNLDALKDELKHLYKEKFFDITKVDHLLRTLISTKLAHLLPQITRLASLSLTMPTVSIRNRAASTARHRAMYRYSSDAMRHLYHNDEFYLRVEDQLCWQLLDQADVRHRVIDRFYTIYPSAPFPVPSVVYDSEFEDHDYDTDVDDFDF